MSIEYLLKQTRDRQQAEYALIVALSGCLSRLVPLCEYMLDYDLAYKADEMRAEVVQAKQLLGMNQAETTAPDWGSAGAAHDGFKPVMRCG